MMTKTAAKPEAKPALNVDRSGLLQRKCDYGKSASLTGQCSNCEQKKLLQRRATDSSEVSEVPPIVHEVLRSPASASSRPAHREIPLPIPIHPLEGQRSPELQTAIASLGPGQPLSPSLRSALPPEANAPLDEVRLHDNPASHLTANVLNSEAFTFGNQIIMGDPAASTRSRDWLLAHEIAHTLQQYPQTQQPIAQDAEAEANQFADSLYKTPKGRAGVPSAQPLLPSLGSAPIGLARRSIWRHTQDLPGNLLLVLDVDDGDFVGGCVRAIVPHVGAKLIMKGVPRGAGNQVFNIHVGFFVNPQGQSCVFFYESVSGLCEMKCFSSQEELDEAWEEVKEWLKDLVKRVLEALLVAAIVVAIVVLAYLIVEAIAAALLILA